MSKKPLNEYQNTNENYNQVEDEVIHPDEGEGEDEFEQVEDCN